MFIHKCKALLAAALLLQLASSASARWLLDDSATSICTGFDQVATNATQWIFSSFILDLPASITAEAVGKNATDVITKIKSDLKSISLDPAYSLGYLQSIGIALTSPTGSAISIVNATDGVTDPKVPTLTFAVSNPSSALVDAAKAYKGKGVLDLYQFLTCQFNASNALTWADTEWLDSNSFDPTSKDDIAAVISYVNKTLAALQPALGSVDRGSSYAIQLPEGVELPPGFSLPPVELPAPVSSWVRQQSWPIKLSGDSVGNLINTVDFYTLDDAKAGKNGTSSGWTVEVDPTTYTALKDSSKLNAFVADIKTLLTAIAPPVAIPGLST